MDDLEPIFTKYGYELDIHAKYNIVSLHTNYYLNNRRIALELKKNINYAVDLLYERKGLYVGLKRIDSNILINAFSNGIIKEITNILRNNEEKEIQLISDILFNNFERTIDIFLNDNPMLSLDSYLQNFASSVINESHELDNFLSTNTNDKDSGYGFEKFTDIKIVTPMAFTHIWAEILRIRSQICKSLYSRETNIDQNNKEIYKETCIYYEQLINFIKKDKKSFKQEFLHFIIFLVKENRAVDNLNLLEDDEINEEIMHVIKELLTIDIKTAIGYLKKYVCDKPIDNNLVEIIIDRCKHLINNKRQNIYEKDMNTINKALEKIQIPAFLIIFTYFQKRIEDEIKRDCNNHVKSRILLAYHEFLNEQYNKYNSKNSSEYLTVNQGIERRSKTGDLTIYGVNYALVAQFIYSILSKNIIAVKELGTNLKQREGAAIYDILNALGYTGSRLSNEKYNEEKSKYQAIRPCFKLNTSGGYDLNIKV